MFTSCQFSSMKEVVGNYKGGITNSINKTLIPINGSISSQNKNAYTVAVDCVSTSNVKCHYQFNISSSFKGKYLVQISGDAVKTIKFSFNVNNLFNDRPCVKNDDFEFCFSDNQLIISFKDNAHNPTLINLTKLNKTGEDFPPMEIPRNYTFSELLERASRYDFTTRISFQRYLEAKYNAKAILLSQLPHINSNSLGNILGGLSGAVVLQLAGDLVPFLLPSRWFDVKIADILSEAETESAVIMKLNAVLFTEQLAYNYEKDKNISLFLKNERFKINQIYNELIVHEKNGQIPLESSLDVLSIINNIDQALLLSVDMQIADLRALAMSVGLRNPEAITDIIFDKNRTLSDLEWDRDSIDSRAIALSHEIHQADLLVKVAKKQKIQRYFTMFDPNATSSLSLGASLYPTSKQSNAQIAEFELIKSQVRNQTTSTVYEVLDELEYSVNNQVFIKKSIDIQQRRVKRILNQLSLGAGVDLSDLVWALQDQMTAQSNEISTSAIYKAAEAELDRIIINGIYQKYNSINK